MSGVSVQLNGRQLAVAINLGTLDALMHMPVMERAAVIRNATEAACEGIATFVDQQIMESGGATPRPGNLLPSATQTPSCRGCGTYVEKFGDVCPVCQDKPQFAAPKATREMGAQPDPAYRDSGSPASPRA